MYVCREDQVPPWLFTHLVHIVRAPSSWTSVCDANMIEDVGATTVAVLAVLGVHAALVVIFLLPFR